MAESAPVITLRFGPDDILRCRFARSALWETVSAVRTLGDRRQQHYHGPWLQARGVASQLDLDDLLALHTATGYVPDFLTPPPQRAFQSFADELAQVRRTPLKQVRKEICRTMEQRPENARDRLRSMAEDPADALARLTDVLQQAWLVLLAPYWPAVQDLLEADVRFHSQLLADGGLERLFDHLHPRVRWRNGCLQVCKTADDHRDLDGVGLVLMPSVFTWPGLVVILDQPWQPTLIYPARRIEHLWGSALPPPGTRLGRLLGRTRAALLVALDEPASTTALAARHRVGASTVSEHLAVLRDAGLVSASRFRHEVRYSRTPLGTALASGIRASSEPVRKDERA